MPHRARRSQWAAEVWRSHHLLQMARALIMKGIVNLLSGLSRSRLVCHTRGMSLALTNHYKYKNHTLADGSVTSKECIAAQLKKKDRWIRRFRGLSFDW
jgi:hypothetical protein